MKTPGTGRLARAALILVVAGATALVATSSQAAPETAGGGRDWVGTWSTALTPGNATGGLTKTGLNDQSARMLVQTTVGGERLRVRLSNMHGDRVLQVGHATVARPNLTTPELSDIDPATVRELTFQGQRSTRVYRASEVLSDPVSLPIGDLQDLVITVYFPVTTGPTTFHYGSMRSTFLGTGDHVTDAGGAAFTRTLPCCWFFVAGVDVLRRREAGAVAVLGDSIADGAGSTLDANRRWPDLLARRLLADRPGGRAPAVLNLGVSGNRLSHEGIEPGTGFPGFNEAGSNGVGRLLTEVLPQNGVDRVIVDLGINDIWMNNEPADVIINALRQILAQAHQRDLEVIACTLLPYEGHGAAGVWTPEKDATRQAVNAWLRANADEFDGLVDFDAVLRDPARPSRLLPGYDSGDHIHPNDAGNQLMADAIPLRLVR